MTFCVKNGLGDEQYEELKRIMSGKTVNPVVKKEKKVSNYARLVGLMAKNTPLAVLEHVITPTARESDPKVKGSVALTDNQGFGIDIGEPVTIRDVWGKLTPLKHPLSKVAVLWFLMSEDDREAIANF
jgi:hypothetical protein